MCQIFELLVLAFSFLLLIFVFVFCSCRKSLILLFLVRANIKYHTNLFECKENKLPLFCGIDVSHLVESHLHNFVQLFTMLSQVCQNCRGTRTVKTLESHWSRNSCNKLLLPLFIFFSILCVAIHFALKVLDYLF